MTTKELQQTIEAIILEINTSYIVAEHNMIQRQTVDHFKSRLLSAITQWAEEELIGENEEVTIDMDEHVASYITGQNSLRAVARTKLAALKE